MVVRQNEPQEFSFSFSDQRNGRRGSAPGVGAAVHLAGTNLILFPSPPPPAFICWERTALLCFRKPAGAHAKTNYYRTKIFPGGRSYRPDSPAFRTGVSGHPFKELPPLAHLPGPAGSPRRWKTSA